MSTKGIYTALSGAMAQNQKLETIANNIANVNTTGFKKDQQTFREYLTSYEKDGDVITVPRVTASVESFYDQNGGDKSYVESNGTYTDFSQGAIKPTGNNLDLAIEGNAFFEVNTPVGVRMTRNGSLTINNQGQLTTKEGYPVLLDGDPNNPQSRIITTNGGNFNIASDGSVFVNNQNIGKISLVTVEPLQALHKGGGSLYGLKDNMNPTIVRNAPAKVQQGFLEGSNVNIVKEMTDMIATTRLFESSQKAMSAFDQMDEKLVNSVPQLK
jgi:flagellar basal-body rod protein FlgG